MFQDQSYTLLDRTNDTESDLENKIYQLVYQRYNLTEEEIKIIEGV